MSETKNKLRHIILETQSIRTKHISCSDVVGTQAIDDVGNDARMKDSSLGIRESIMCTIMEHV